MHWTPFTLILTLLVAGAWLVSSAPDRHEQQMQMARDAAAVQEHMHRLYYQHPPRRD